MTTSSIRALALLVLLHQTEEALDAVHQQLETHEDAQGNELTQEQLSLLQRQFVEGQAARVAAYTKSWDNAKSELTQYFGAHVLRVRLADLRAMYNMLSPGALVEHGSERANEEDTELCIGFLVNHEQGPGYYFWLAEYPEEGADRLLTQSGSPLGVPFKGDAIVKT